MRTLLLILPVLALAACDGVQGFIDGAPFGREPRQTRLAGDTPMAPAPMTAPMMAPAAMQPVAQAPMAPVAVTPAPMAPATVQALPPGSPVARVGVADAYTGANAANPVAGHFEIRDDASWQRLWQLIGQPAPMALPPGMQAVAVLLGPRNDGATVTIMDILDDATTPPLGRLIARFAVLPGPSGVTTRAYAIRLVPAGVRPVFFAPAN